MTSNLFPAPKGKEQDAYGKHAAFKVAGSDPLTFLKVYEAWTKSGENVGWARENFLGTKALDQMSQFRRQMTMNLKRLELFTETESFTQEIVTKTVASGLIVNLAKHGYKYSYRYGEEIVWIHPGSAANGSEFSLPQFVVFTLVMQTSKPFMRGVQTVPEAWFNELVPNEVREHAWEIRQNYTTRDWEFRHATKWNGICLSDEVVTSWSSEAVVSIADKIVEQIRDNSLTRACHAQIPELRRFYQELKSLLGIDWLDMARDDELCKKIAGKLAQKLANVLTVSDFVRADLKLELIDFLTPEQITQNNERLAVRRAEEVRLAEENRVYMERQRVIREAEETRHAAERAQDEIVRGPLRAEVAQLDQRLSDLGVSIKYEYGLRSDYSIQQAARGSVRSSITFSLNEAREYIRLYRSIVEREEGNAKEKFAQTQVIYDQVLALMPECPMCGNGWNQNHRCTTKHDADRIIPIPRRDYVESIIGHFVTNKGDKIATLRIEGNGEIALFFVVSHGRVFTGKEFTSIAFEADQEILPKHLAQDASDIREFLADLEAQRAAVERIREEIAEQQRAVTSMAVNVLVFDRKNAAGFVTAMHREMTYVAQYKAGELYPEIGERWICGLQKKTGVSLSGSCEAYPMKKLTGAVTSEDVRRSALEIAEAYVGIPQTLLQ